MPERRSFPPPWTIDEAARERNAEARAVYLGQRLRGENVPSPA
jgi:hypothetical protein